MLLSNVCVVTSFYQSLQAMSSFMLFSICATYCTLSAMTDYKIVPEAILDCSVQKQNPRDFHHRGFVLALPIFPGRLQPSIVGRSELNFRVRDGNGWTLALINTNCQHSSIPSCRPKCNFLHPENRTMYRRVLEKAEIACTNCRSSPRAISTGQLHTLLHFHLRPINQIVFLGPYSKWMRDLILGRVSRLDAFSVYLVRT